MAKYWVISPHNFANPELWEKVWQYDLENGTIAIGWRELGDISSLDKEQLEKAIENTWPNDKPGAKAYSLNAVWNFWHEIQIGDVVIAKKGAKQLAAVGTVKQTAFYSVEKGKERVGNHPDFYPNFITVQWHESPRNVSFDKMVFAFSAIYQTDKEGYDRIVKAVPKSEEDKELLIVLERYLEELIVSNFDKIFKEEFRLYVTPTGETGRQYPTEIGIIDILAIEPTTGSFVVIELKKGRPADKVVGQTLHYMGWVDEFLCKDGQLVKGMIICEGADPELLSALRMTPNIELKYYKIDFELEDVGIERGKI